MGKSCVYMPKKGAETYLQLKKKFGREIAANIFNRVITDEFIEDFGDSLTLDSEGVPTFYSLMALPIIRNYIGKDTIIESLNKEQEVLENTIENVSILVKKAKEMNDSSSDYVAIVDYTEEGDLTIKVLPNTEENRQTAKYQQAIEKLNTTVTSLLQSAGITPGMMSTIEVAAGKVGETNFNHAKQIADEFTGIIRIANNMQGAVALSEEFSHLLVGIYEGIPLMQRAINFLSNEKEARKVLGDKFDEYYEEYNGDMSLVAEEAVGQMLRDQFLNISMEQNKVPLFSRIKNYITKLFKGINPSYYQNSIDAIKSGLEEFAKEIVTGKKTITKEDIAKLQEDKKFYALGEKAREQDKIAKKIAARLHAESTFTQNSEEGREKVERKISAIETATEVRSLLNKEETVEALATLLNHANKSLEEAFESLGNVDNLNTKEKFIALSNALTIIQSNGKTIEELYSVLSEEILDDPEIMNQHFMLQDGDDSLREFRTTGPVTAIDTSNMTSAQIASLITKYSDDLELSPDEKYYINKKTGAKYLRTTYVIQAYNGGHTFDPNSAWVTPSTNIGTGIDELVRDFMSGRIRFNRDNNRWEVEGEELNKVYPNATNDDLNLFVSQLYKLKKKITEQGISLISRDVTIEGTVDTTDGRGRVHTINVAGTLDLLGYDNNGNWYIYDMKTHRGELNQDTKDKYARQVSLYKKLLEDKYGIKIKNLSIIPIKVQYPAPLGSTSGTARYSVDTNKSSKYNGKRSNQLIKDGQKFTEAKPFLEDTIDLEEITPDVNYSKLSGSKTGGETDVKAYIIDALKTAAHRHKQLEERFYTKSTKAFAAFLIPFVGETIRISDGKGGLKTVSIEEVIKKSDRDITYMQRYFTTMADNPDGLLQAFDKVVKVQKNKQRLRLIELSQKVLALGKEYEDKGVRNYDFMFEDDNQRYINKTIIDGKDYSFNRYAYEQAYKKYSEQLDNLYGKHPQVGSKEYKKKKELLSQWIKQNTQKVTINGKETSIPKHSLYPSKYSSLSTAQKEFYDKWIAVKSELDALLPDNATTTTNTIKIRKTGIERWSDLLKNGNVRGFVDNIKASFIKSYDDANNYHGIVDLTENEKLVLPLYYLKASDTSNLTHDVIGSLIAYADMALNYEVMNDVINPLEIGRTLALNNRDIPRTRGGRSLLGVVRAGDREETRQGMVDPKASKFGELLEDFFASKVYEQYLVDNGTIGNADTNKLVGLALKLGSAIQLGVNTLAHMANTATGIAMQNIEAAAGQFFNARDLASADTAFIKEIPHYLGDIGQRITFSKLALINEVFNVKQDYRRKARKEDFLNRTIIGRLFGPRLQFLGQDAGDFWLYNRTAISILKREKLIKTDKFGHQTEISLWDALITVPIDKDHPEYGNKLVLQEGVTKKDGSAFTQKDFGEMTDKIGDLNRHLFGVYNDEDSIAARRYMWGRFLMQYRDWIPSQFRYRFGVKTHNLDSGQDFEGYYRTTIKFIWGLRQELADGQKTVSQVWRGLDDYQRANIKRATFEVSQFFVISLICMLLGARSKDKDRSWVERTMTALLFREKTELGALTAGLQMPKEFINIIKSPVANANIWQDISDLASVINPTKYFDEIETGDYKGHSSAYRSFIRSIKNVYYKNLYKTVHPEIMQRYYENIQE